MSSRSKTGVTSYDAMCEAIKRCESMLASDLDKLSVAEQLRVCAYIIKTNQDVERKAREVRLRAEYGLGILLREAAGMQPKNRRDAKWLAARA